MQDVYFFLLLLILQLESFSLVFTLFCFVVYKVISVGC